MSADGNTTAAPARPAGDEEIIVVRIGYEETGRRERAKRLGAIWRHAQELREMRWLEAKRLGIADRVVTG